MKSYICIDLKSFYASVECVRLNLNPLKTNLVVADKSRTEKTICLAVSPSLKSFGISGRPRLFEVIQKVKEVNKERIKKVYHFIGKSYDIDELNNPRLELDYIVATPHMRDYMSISSKIYKIYLKYFASEDIHSYSIDEVFIDATNYLKGYNMTAYDLTNKIIRDILKETGITATAGIGTNLYLAKVAMDIIAKKIQPDKYGVRIAFLDEYKYRKLLWNHQPLTDFWRIGKGYATRLNSIGLYTMGDIARCSLGGFYDKYNEDLLYNEFGINAELIIDHAWGYEPCLMKDIKSYVPENNSYGMGQVLHCPYDYDKAKLVVKEMADQLSLDLVGKNLVTNQLMLLINYDIENVNNLDLKESNLTLDCFGRKIPKHANATINVDYTSSTNLIVKSFVKLYDSIVDKSLLIRKINISSRVYSKDKIVKKKTYEQIDLFSNKKNEDTLNTELEKELKAQKAIIDIKNKFGKNSVLKGMNLEKDATMKEKNEQIGGHKA